MQAAQLERLTADFSDCKLVAYADIGTGVTLVTAGPDDVPREALDELCTEAALTLGKPDAPALGASSCPLVIKSVEQAVFVFMRSETEPDDALLCMCRHEIDMKSFLAAARSCLDGGV